MVGKYRLSILPLTTPYHHSEKKGEIGKLRKVEYIFTLVSESTFRIGWAFSLEGKRRGDFSNIFAPPFTCILVVVEWE